MFKKLIKQIIRKMAWTVKKKTIMQILTPRRKWDGMPEYGRFTSRDMVTIFFLSGSLIRPQEKKWSCAGISFITRRTDGVLRFL